MNRKILIAAVLLLAFVLLLSSCGSGQTAVPDESKETEPADTQLAPDTETSPSAPLDTEPDTAETEEQTPRDVISVGIYDCIYEDYYEERYGLVRTLYDDMSRGIDLCVVGIFLSQEDVVSGPKFQDIWRDCASKAGTDVTAYRTGFLMEFATADGSSFSRLIMRPEDITQDESWEYVETYTYDDIANEFAGWYYHLTPDTFDENSLMTSFKVTAGSRIKEVGEIHLTVFLYTRDEMDSIYGNRELIRELNSYSAVIIPSENR